jgi:DNA topoisomerase IB
MAWGGARPGAGRKPQGAKKANPNKPRQVAEPKMKPVAAIPAEPRSSPDPLTWAAMREATIRSSQSQRRERTPENNPFRLPQFPAPLMKALADRNLPTMAMDTSLVGNLESSAAGWLNGDIFQGASEEGMLFLGYNYLALLAQRNEYRNSAAALADDATRKWIDFDVVGDEKKQKEDRSKDPAGFDEAMADPDQQKKRVAAAGKADKVKALKDDALRLELQARFHDQVTNGEFFGRTHLFLDIRPGGKPGEEIDPKELVIPIGDSRDARSKSKVPKGSFQGLRTIEPMWTYPLMYNAINPIREDWYSPKVWFVMGQEIHGTRLQTFIPHPVPGMLKPAYAFGGLSMTQLIKPYVDIWLQTKQSVADLIRNFSMMVLLTDLSTLMQPGNVNNLIARAQMMNAMRDNQGMFVGNKASEDVKNVSAPLGGLDHLQAQAQEHLCSANRIPLVKFTGISPSGLNATSEQEIEVWDDTVGAYQTYVLDPNLRRIINFQQLSLWGEIDPEISHRWNKLRDLTPAEKGQRDKDDADTMQKYVDMGAFGPDEVRVIAINNPELPFTDLDPDDVPEPPAEEGIEGPGAGGAAAAFEKDATGQEESNGAQDEAAFEESKHPRAPDGKFGSGSGSSSKSSHQTTKIVDGKRVTATGSPLPSHIQSLKIPPAWTDVTFSDDPKSSLLATGKDVKGRRQAVYSAEFSAGQAAAKFSRINELNQKYSGIYAQNEEARKSDDAKKRAAADCAHLIMTTGIRPGSEDDTGADKKAYGATTLEGKHVVVDGDNVSLKFVGKKGVSLDLPVTDPGTAAMLRDRKAAAGDEGQLFPINEKTLLDHVHSFDGGGFKTKDFRTLLGTRTAMSEVDRRGIPTNEKDYKKAVMEVAKVVSSKLGNTPVIALQSYINPSVFSAWKIAV